MKQLSLRTSIPLLLLSFLLAGCGLFGGAAREREQQNEAVTQGASLGQVVTAEGIGEKNAPVKVTNQFSPSQDYIYVVAEATSIQKGTTLFARWSRDNKPFEDSSAITADSDYKDTYVEFHLENLKKEMQKGDYSVQLFVNGNPVKKVDFKVS